MAAPVVLAGLVGVGFLLELDRRGVERGFPLDDSWIHLRFASNLAKGGGFACNPGEPTPGATSPLWVVVLAAAAKAGIPLEAAAVLLGLLFNAGACAALMVLSRGPLDASGEGATGGEDARFWIPFGVGFFFVLTPCVVWSSVSGLEISLFMLLSFGGLILHENACERGGWRWPASALVFGLATHARPEGHLLFAAAALERVVREWPNLRARPAARLPALIGYGLAYVVTISPYIIFCLSTTGRPLPNTYYAKTIGEREILSLHYFKLLIRQLGWEHFVLGLFVPVGLVAHLARKRGSLLPVLWVLGLPLGYTLMPRNCFTVTAGNFTRYFYPVIPLLAMFGVHGLAVAATAIGHRLRGGRALAALLLCLLCGADSLLLVLDRRELFVTNVRNINEMDVAAAKWIRNNTPKGARLAVGDVGAIPHFSDRYVFDTVGLVTPGLLPYIEEHARDDEPFAETPLAMFLDRVKPDYLIVFPGWYPNIIAGLEELGAGRKMKEFTIEGNVTCGAATMVVYKLAWQKRPQARERRLPRPHADPELLERRPP